MNSTAILDEPLNIVSPEPKVVLPFEKTGEYYIESLGEIPKKPVYSFFKRTMDIILSGIAMIVLAVPMLIIAVLVKIKSPGPVFYSQDRLGYNGKNINIIKFRTMNVDAEKNGAQWSQGDEDPRIYPFGRILRKFRLDELPQLWCIFKGDLSIVGPRPEREIFYNEFETYVHGFRERLKVKPGLTGLAQVSGGYDLKPEEKILYDVEYIKKRSLWQDMKIMLKTIGIILNGGGQMITLNQNICLPENSIFIYYLKAFAIFL